MAFRRTYFLENNPKRLVVVGDTITHGRLCFRTDQCTDMVLTVSSYNEAQDWFAGTFKVIYTYPTTTASNPRTYTAWYTDLARISTLQNNKDKRWYISTTVNIRRTVSVASGTVFNSSPVSNNAAIVTAYRENTPFTFKVSASDPEKKTLTFSAATAALLGGPNDNSQIQPPGLECSSSGTITWKTWNTGTNNGRLPLGLYCTQIRIDDGNSYSVVDFIINLIERPNNPPYFVIPPTPEDGSIIRFPPLVRSTVTLRAKTDATTSGLTVSISTSSIPSGSTLANPSGSKDVSRVLSWTPTRDDVGVYVVSATCEDSNGLSSAGQQSFVINVADKYCINGRDPAHCDPSEEGNCLCICDANYDGARCDECKPGFYGANCRPCDSRCVNGDCQDGIDGSGVCLCYAGWQGEFCNRTLGIICDPRAPSYKVNEIPGNGLTTPAGQTIWVTQNTTFAPFQVNFRTAANTVVPALDVLLLADNSRNIGTLDKLKGEAASKFVLALRALANNNNAQVGLASFNDKDGGANFFKLLAPLGLDYTSGISDLTGTNFGGTGADPDGQLDALILAATTAGVGWRSNSFKVIVMVTDSAFNEGSVGGYSYTTRAATMKVLAENNIVPVFITNSAAQSTYTTLTTNTWKFGTQLTTDNNWNNALPQAAIAVGNVIKIVNTVVAVDDLGFVESTSAISATVSGASNVASWVKVRLPPQYAGQIQDVPRISINTVGYSQQTVTLSVNRSPIPYTCSITTPEDTPANLPVTGVDPDGNVMRLKLQTLPTLGTLFQSRTSSVRLATNVLYPFPDGNPVSPLWYVPDKDKNGQDSFRYLIDDGCAVSIVVSCTINISPVNDEPIADLVSAETNENTPVTVELTGTDAEDRPDQLKAKIISLPSPLDGVIRLPGSTADITVNQIIPNRMIQFTPVRYRSAYGASFQFQVLDTNGASSASSTASIYVVSVDEAPVASGETPVVAERTVPRAIALKGFDADPEEALEFIVHAITPGNGVFKDANGVTLTAGSSIGFGYPDSSYNAYVYPTYTASATETKATNIASITFKIVDRSELESNKHTIVVDLKPNSAPTATPQSVTVIQDSPYVITLSGTDPEPYDASSLTAIVTSVPSTGTLKVGSVTITTANIPYTLPANRQVEYLTYSRLADSFKFIVRDRVGTPSVAAATVSITVTPVNHPPVASVVYLETDEDKDLVIDMAPPLNMISAFDPDGDATEIVISALPVASKGTWKNGDGSTITAASVPVTLKNGKLTFSPAANQFGNPWTSFSFYATDNKPENNKSPVVVANIVVKPVNDAPTALPQTVNVDEDQSVNITLGVEDIDNDVNTVSAIVWSLPNPDFGALYTLDGRAITTGQDIGALKRLTFRTVPYKFGTTSFTFKANDGELLSVNPATVNIIINHVNHRPTSSATSPVSATRSVALPITLNGADMDIGDSLTFVLKSTTANGGTFSRTSGGASVAPNTNLVTVTNPTSRQVSTQLFYTPPANANTNPFASFVFFVRDQDNSASADTTVTINIDPNNRPTANPASIIVYQDSSNTTKLTGNDVDVADANSLVVEITALPSIGTLKQGSTTLTVGSRLNVAQNTVTYSTTQRGTGVTFRFKVIDTLGFASTPDTVVPITIIPVNHRPTATVGAIVLDEDTTITIGSQITASDPDGDSTTIYISALPVGKGVFKQNQGGAIISPTPTTAVALLDGRMTYTPPLNENGMPQYTNFTFYVDDKQNTAVSKSFPVNAVIGVRPVNDPPVAHNGKLIVPESTVSANITLNVTDIDNANSALNAKITSLPSASLGVLRTTGGALVAVNDIVNSPRDLAFHPVQFAHGTTSFTFLGHDGDAYSGSATFTIEVTPVKDAPTCSPKTAIVSRGQTVDIDLELYDPDVTDTYKFTVSSWALDSQSELFTESGDKVLTIPTDLATGKTSTTPYAYATVSVSTAGTSGNSTFSYTVDDGTGTPTSAPCLVNVIVSVNNDPPTAHKVDPLSILEETTSGAILLNGTDPNPIDYPDLVVVVTDLPTNGRVFLEGSTTAIKRNDVFTKGDGVRVVYTPNDLFNGQDNFKFLIRDPLGATSAKETVAITVIHVNHRPTASWLEDVTTPEDITAEIRSISAADIDINPKNTVTVYVKDLPLKGTLLQWNNVEITKSDTLITDSGYKLKFRPVADDSGSPYAQFTFYAHDNTNTENSNSTVVTGRIHVTPVNDAPVAIPDSVEGDEDQVLPFSLKASDIDNLDGDLSAVIVTLPDPAKGILLTTSDAVVKVGDTIPAPRSLKFKPLDYTYGRTFLTFRAYDGQLNSANTARVNITIHHVNHPPTADSATPVVATRGVPLAIVLNARDVDLNDKFNFTITSLDNGGRSARSAIEPGKFHDVDGNEYTASSFILASNVPNTAARTASTQIYFTAPKTGKLSPFARLSFTVTDGIETTTEHTVVINLADNTPPVANPAGPIYVYQDGVSVLHSLNGTDVDVADDPVFVILEKLPTKGQLLINGDVVTSVGTVYTDLKVAYTTTQRGTDRFTFYVQDHVGAKSSPMAVDIEIYPVNHPPTGSVSTITTNEDTQVDITSITAVDPDSDPVLTVWISQLPAVGTLTQFDGEAITDLPAQITDPSYRLKFTPLPNENSGADNVVYASFKFYVNDNQPQNNISSEVVANIYVTPVNDGPTALPGQVTLAENAPPAVVKFQVDDIDTPLVNVSVRITSLPDESIGSLTTVDGTTVAVGSLVPHPHELRFAPVPYAHGNTSFNFLAFDGQLSSTETVFSISVTPVNQAPVASAASPVTAQRLVPVDIVLSATDHDTPETFQFKILTSEANGGKFTTDAGVDITAGEFVIATVPKNGSLTSVGIKYVAPATAIGTSFAHFRFAVFDGENVKSNEVNVTVNINAGVPPVATPAGPITFLEETVSGTYNLNGTDEDIADTVLTTVIASLPSLGVLVVDGKDITVAGTSFTGPVDVSVRGHLFSHGSDSFTFRVVDSVGYTSAAETVQIIITHVNHPPTAYVTVSPGLENIDLPFSVSGTDPDRLANGASNVLVRYITKLPTIGSILVNGVPVTEASEETPALAEGTLVYRPGKDQHGSPLAHAEFIVDDSTNTSNSRSPVVRANFTIIRVDRKPSAYGQNLTMNQNERIRIQLTGSDPQNYPLVYTIRASPPDDSPAQLFRSDGTLITLSNATIGYDGIVDYVPPINAYDDPKKENVPYGYFTFYTSGSTLLSSDDATVLINVVKVNEPPYALNTDISVQQTATRLFNLVILSEQFLRTELKVTIVNTTTKQPLYTSNGDLVKDGDVLTPDTISEFVRLSYTAPADEEGPFYDKLVYKVIDPNTEVSELYTLNINVTHKYLPPTFVPISTTTKGVTTAWEQGVSAVSIDENTDLLVVFDVTDKDTLKQNLAVTVGAVPTSVRGSLYLVDSVSEEGTVRPGAKLTEQNSPILPSSDGLYRLFFVPSPDSFRQNYYTFLFFATDDTPLDQSGPFNTGRVPLQVNVRAINSPPSVNIPVPEYTTTIGSVVAVNDVTVNDTDARKSPSSIILVELSGGLITANGDVKPVTITVPNDNAKKPSCTTTNNVVSCYDRLAILNNVLLTRIEFTDGGVVGTYYLNVLVNDLGVGAEVGEQDDNHMTAQANATITVNPIATVAVTTTENNNVMTAVIAASSAAGVGAAFGAWRFLSKRRPPTTDFFGMEGMADSAIVDNPLYENTNMNTFDNVLYESPDAN